MYSCNYCSKILTSMSSLGGHVQYCSDNPNRRVSKPKEIESLSFIPEHRFLDNKYTKLYFKLLSKKYDSDYYERHHVIPRSMGGSDDKSNLVDVTSRVHFLCHYLLTKMTVGLDRRKMYNAFICMRASPDKNSSRYVNSRLYAQLRENFSESMRNVTVGKLNSQYGSAWATNVKTCENRKLHKFSVLNKDWKWGRYAEKREVIESPPREIYFNLKRKETEEKYIEYMKLFSNGDYNSVEDFKKKLGITVSYVSIIKGWKKLYPELSLYIKQGVPFNSSTSRRYLIDYKITLE